MRARAQLPGRAGRRGQGAAALPPQPLFLGLWRGWGLYSEWLGHPMGIYRTPYEKFGQQSYEMWRAARLVIDTGLHRYGWSRRQAIDYLASHTALSSHEVETEVDRYISWPGQALSYKLGELTIRRLRGEAEKALGPLRPAQVPRHDPCAGLGAAAGSRGARARVHRGEQARCRRWSRRQLFAPILGRPTSPCPTVRPAISSMRSRGRARGR